MNHLHKIQNIFPSINEIPSNMDIPEQHEQQLYLLEGELKKWDGHVQDIFSPVFIKENDVLVRKRLGSYPLLGEKESLEALASAQKAYNIGRGEWPTMPVKKRIEHMLLFTTKMKEQRSVIDKYLMWEIGKSLKDSEKASS